MAPRDRAGRTRQSPRLAAAREATLDHCAKPSANLEGDAEAEAHPASKSSPAPAHGINAALSALTVSGGTILYPSARPGCAHVRPNADASNRASRDEMRESCRST